jgi:quercetin dioxygenase-like cupin family protein
MKGLFNIIFNRNNTPKIKASDVARNDFKEIHQKVKDFKHNLLFQLDEGAPQPTPSATIKDIAFIKNEWVRLPDAVGNGVLSMGVEETEKRKSFLVHYEPNSELFTHKHPHNIERIQVLTGYIQDNITGEKVNEGGTYLIDKNQPHNIVTLDKESYLFIVFSEELDTLTVNHLIE